MKITKRKLKKIIAEEVENLEYAFAQKVAVPSLSVAEYPEDVEAHEDAWAGGRNLRHNEDHLKAYGITFWNLEKGQNVDWLLNYRGGSFLIKNNSLIKDECVIRGVSYEIIADLQSNLILEEILKNNVNKFTD